MDRGEDKQVLKEENSPSGGMDRATRGRVPLDMSVQNSLFDEYLNWRYDRLGFMKMRYLRIAPWRVWKWMLSPGFHWSRFGIFRNLPHIYPGRWGIYILGFEIGSRNPRDKIGLWLKNHGLYPW